MIPKINKRKKSYDTTGVILWILAFIIILFIISSLIVANINIRQKKKEVKDQVSAIEKQIAIFQDKNNKLQQDIDKSNDTAYIEKVAREDLSMQKTGESVVAFVLPEKKEEPQRSNPLNPSSWLDWFKAELLWIKSKF